MDLKQILNDNLYNLNKELLIIEKADEKQISILIKEFENKLYKELKEYCQDDSKLKNIIKDKFVENIKDMSLDINDTIYESLKDINKSIKEIMLFMLVNPLVNVKTITKIDNVYGSKVKEINPFNEKFKFIYKKNFDLLIYYLSVDFKLKYQVESYKKINNIIDSNKKYLLNEIIKIINNKKKNNHLLFKKHLLTFSNSLQDSLKEIKKINYIKINNYIYSKLEEYTNDEIEKYLNENYKYITTSLEECHSKVVKKLKIKETKVTTKNLLILKDYLLGYNNTLFSKAIKCLNDMNTVVELEKEKANTKLNEYNDSIYAIYDLDYNFDKQFNDYKVSMLKKKSVVVTQKSIDDTNEIIDLYKNEIILVIKNNISTLFKECLINLTNVSNKTNIIKYKLSDFIEEIDDKQISGLYKK